MHGQINLKGVGLAFASKICFDNFSTRIYPGSRIAIVGRNGSGKSSLLNIIAQNLAPSEGEMVMSANLQIGYVEQVISDCDELNGGQRFNKKLSMALAHCPDVLLLDEPTNHLDKDNRNSLLQMLSRYQGTLIIVSHDQELLRNCVDILWHIDNKKIIEFSGCYDDYIQAIKQKRLIIENNLLALRRDKKEAHHLLMKEQQRAAKSRSKGQKSIGQKKWPSVVSKAKELRAEQTSGKKRLAIDKKKQQLITQLSELRLPEIIIPKFSLGADSIGSRSLLTINDAAIGYAKSDVILQDVNISMVAKERIAICGKNGSGKSTALKAIMGQEQIIKTGLWHLPSPKYIGYLDQHYANLYPELSVIEHICQLRPDWDTIEYRQHLNDFLFRKNEEIMQLIANLSGGEKARLSLFLIAAQVPRLLLFDEVTNNLDLETKEHIVQVIKQYPGAMIVISHDEDFLQDIGIERTYTVADGRLV